jgi:GNAT superfamily N-acetyltransferase
MHGELERRGFGNYEGRQLGQDAQFATRYVEEGGNQAWMLRHVATHEPKPNDQTLAGTADFANHRLLVRDARRTYGTDVPIHSEEGLHLRPEGLPIAVAGDSLDGTGQYAATHWDPATERFITQHYGEPLPPGAIPIQDSERSSCVVVGVFRYGVLSAAAMYAPYTDELLLADRELGGTFLNGHRIDLSTNPAAQQASFQPGIPYDFSSWRGSLLDPRHLRKDLEGPPNSTYSASKQVCDVLTLRSMTSVFTGDTIHDMLLALAVELAGGVVTDLRGNKIDWNNPRGAVYSVNKRVHAGTIAAINAPRIDGLPPGYSPVKKGQVSAEEILDLRTTAQFGTEQRLPVWEDALDKAHAFVGAREISTGRLVLASFLTGSARHGTLHDLVVDPAHRRIGLASHAIDKRVELAASYRAGGETVGMSYLDVDLGIRALGMVPLLDCFQSHGFEPNSGGLMRDYRHDNPAMSS